MTYQPIYTQADDKEKFSKIKEYAFKAGYKNCMSVLDGDKIMVNMTKDSKIKEEFKNCEFTDVDVNCISDLQFSKFEDKYMDGMAKAEREMNSIEEEKETEQKLTAF